jgi:hypothetical protein
MAGKMAPFFEGKARRTRFASLFPTFLNLEFSTPSNKMKGAKCHEM